jgi:hypothetical protein
MSTWLNRQITTGISTIPRMDIPLAKYYHMNKDECIAELKADGAKVDRSFGREELRAMLKTSRIERGLIADQYIKDEMKEMLKWKKIHLMEMSRSVGMTVTNKSTMGAMQSSFRAHLLGSGMANTEMEFGAHSNLTYMEVATSKADYCEWATKTAEESETPHWKLLRFVYWLAKTNDQEENLPNADSSKKNIPRLFGKQPASGSSESSNRATPNRAGVPSSADKDAIIQEMALKMQVMETTLAAGRTSRPRKGETASDTSGDFTMVAGSIPVPS